MTTILTVIKNKQAEEEVVATATNATDTKEKIPPHFQAVGIIAAEVKFAEENQSAAIAQRLGKAEIVIEGKEYPLLYIPTRKKTMKLLKAEIEKTASTIQRLIVYPRFLHLPGKEPQQVKFSLLGFVGSNPPPGVLISDVLRDGEFQLSGLWQFIPVCRVPCITIFRNNNKEVKNQLTQLNEIAKKRFLKANHIPLLWRDSTAKPFRYNRNLGKEEQADRYFVQVKARFLPGRDCFGFIKEIDLPSDRIPRFIKPKKNSTSSDHNWDSFDGYTRPTTS